MELASASVLVVEQALLPALMSPRWTPVATCLSGRLSKVALPQTLLSGVPTMCLYMPFKSGVHFPQPSGSPSSKPHQPSRPFCRPIFPMALAPDVGCQSHPPWENLCNYNYFCI